MAIMQTQALGLARQGDAILRDVNFHVEPGHILGLAGPSGSGKSSLLRLLNGLDSPTSGRVLFKGRDIGSIDPVLLRRRVGYVFQKPYLFAGTVRDNLRYAYRVWRLEPDDRAILAWLDRVDLAADVLDRQGHELSGGEQQRVALVRSLLAGPEVLLLDEATASLDRDNAARVEALVLEEQAARGVTTLFVSHDREQLRRLAPTVLALDTGRVWFFGDTETYFQTIGETANE